MSRSTKDLGDVNTVVAIANRNAIVTRSNHTVSNGDSLRTTNVDTISVRAVSWRSYVEIRYRYVGAVSNLHVEPFAIEEVDILHNRISYTLPYKTLHPYKKSLTYVNVY